MGDSFVGDGDFGCDFLMQILKEGLGRVLKTQHAAKTWFMLGGIALAGIMREVFKRLLL